MAYIDRLRLDRFDHRPKLIAAFGRDEDIQSESNSGDNGEEPDDRNVPDAVTTESPPTVAEATDDDGDRPEQQLSNGQTGVDDEITAEPTPNPTETVAPEGGEDAQSARADGGTRGRAETDGPGGPSAPSPQEPDRPEIEVVLEEDPDQLYDTSGSAQRVIDENLNVVKQNRVMEEWTGVDTENRDTLKCMNQLSGAFCGTDNCTVRQLMEQGRQRVEVEVEKELPNGQTKQTLLVSEQITNDRGDVVGITESFTDISNVKAAAEEISNSIGELSETADDVAESSDDIASTAETMAESMDEVTGEVGNVSASVEEVASSAEEVATTSEQAERRAQDGYERAEDAIDEMEDIDAATTEVSQDLADLQRRVDEIDEIVEVINSIADQTNMLALNANIEAARAGKDGEGFAVVANEVKSLAEDAQDNAETIESMIAGIKEDTDETAASLAEANEQVDTGIEQVEATMAALEEIVDAIQEAASGVDEVAEATDDQAASAEEVASLVDQVAEQARTVSSEIQNIYAANEEQAQMVESLEAAVERLEGE